MRHNRPIIDDEFAALLPPASPELIERLEAKLRGEAFREPLVVWEETNILLDGHNRLAICERLGVDYTREYLSFPSREAAKQWVIDNQLARRNLTDEQRDYFIGLDYLNSKQTHGDSKRLGNALVSPSAHFAHLGGGSTADKIAEKHGVHAATVRRDAEFAQAVDAIGAADPQAKEVILSGKSGLSKAEVIKTAPILCTRCRQETPVRDCPQCAEARLTALNGQPPPPATPPSSPQQTSDDDLPPLWWESPEVAARVVKSMQRKLGDIQRNISAIYESPHKPLAQAAQDDTRVVWSNTGENFRDGETPHATLHLRKYTCDAIEALGTYLATLRRRLEGRGPNPSTAAAPWDKAGPAKGQADILI